MAKKRNLLKTSLSYKFYFLEIQKGLLRIMASDSAISSKSWRSMQFAQTEALSKDRYYMCNQLTEIHASLALESDHGDRDL